MKRFILFAGQDHYPGEGWTDMVGVFDSLEEAIAADPGFPRQDWAHVIDTDLVATDRNERVWERYLGKEVLA